jgi:hypothetical protein
MTKLEIFAGLKLYLHEEWLRNSEQLKYSEVGQLRTARYFVFTAVPGTSTLLNDKFADLVV